MCRRRQRSNLLIQAVVSQRAAAEEPAEAQSEATATYMVQSLPSTHKVASESLLRCRRKADKAVQAAATGRAGAQRVHPTWTTRLQGQGSEAGGRAHAGNALHELACVCDAQDLFVDEGVCAPACQIGQGKRQRPGQPTQEGRLLNIKPPFL